MTLPAPPSHLHAAVRDFSIERTVRRHLRDNLTVAGNAVVLNSSGGVGADTEIIAIGFEGHGHGMIVTVLCLGEHFVQESITGQMAINAGRPVPMGTVLPGVIMDGHGVTIDTNLGIA